MRRLLCVVVAAGIAAPAFIGEPHLDAIQAAPSTADAVRLAIERGQYEGAERQAAALYAQVQQTHGLESIELARASDPLIEALLKNGRVASASTLDIAERAVRVKERLAGVDDLDLATSLHNLGALRAARGEFPAALSLHERALALRRRSGSETSAVAESLDALASALILLARFQAAQRYLDEALAIRERRPIEAPLGLARTRELVGLAHLRAGRYQEAANMLDRAVADWDRLAPRHPDKIPALIERGETANLSGEIPAARRLWTDALRLVTDTLRRDHPLMAWVERDLGLSEDALGNIAEARRLREDGLRIAGTMPPCNPEVTGQLNDLGMSRSDEGDFAAARTLYRRQEGILEKCLGTINDDMATAVYNEFEAAREMGAFTEARELGNRAIRIRSQALGPNHPFVAYGSYQLATFETSRKNYAIARTLFERALRIRRQALGEKHPDIALTLIPFARMLAETGSTDRAEASLQEALEILRSAPARFANATGNALEVQALLRQRAGDYQAARASLALALAEKERIYGVAHPYPAATRTELAAADLAVGQYDSALTSALSAEQAGRDALRFTMRSLPERRAMAFASSRPRGLNVALSVAAAGHASASAVFDAVAQSRGVVLDELAARSRSTSGGEPGLETLNAALSSARARYASLMLRNIQGGAVEADVLDQARQQKEDAEEALAQQSASTRAELTRARAGLAEVRRALPARSALVSFVRYDRATFASRDSRVTSRVVPSYLAFIARSDRDEIATVPLGPSTILEDAIVRWRAEVDGHTIAGAAAGDVERTYRLAAAPLRARLWDPVAPHVGDIDRVFIVPDGAINTVSFAALPIGARQYLIESAPVIHYLTTERDLLEAGSTGSEGLVGSADSRGLLAVGGPAYGPPPAATRARATGECGVGPLVFEDLPGSRAEVQDIARLWGPASSLAGASPIAPTVLSGRAANKAAVMNMAGGRRIVHLATHGFFLGSSCAPGAANTRGVGGLAPIRSKRVEENPLLLSGLAFAGANQNASRAAADNGILTAEEIVALNLQGTEWAVLSACDTGLGQIRAGEGVFGLRRAFQIAGVRTVITSLWSVEDRTTRLWMRTLYEGRLRDSLSTADAVRAAGLRVLRDRRARGQSGHPFYWGAFVAAGDWR